MATTRFQLFCHVALVLCAMIVCGCSLISRRYAGPEAEAELAPLPNPLAIPVTHVDFTWDQIVDMMDDYFDISREVRVQEVGGVLMEGRIETQPKTGATVIEPLRRDSTPGYERWHSTFQSIRRRATMRVMPVATGFEVYLTVQKELEDVNQPEFSSVGQAVRRHDGSLSSFPNNRSNRGMPATTLGWISLGRDHSLEQEMLRQLRSRLFEAAELGLQP